MIHVFEYRPRVYLVFEARSGLSVLLLWPLPILCLVIKLGFVELDVRGHLLKHLARLLLELYHVPGTPLPLLLLLLFVPLSPPLLLLLLLLALMPPLVLLVFLLVLLVLLLVLLLLLLASPLLNEVLILFFTVLIVVGLADVRGDHDGVLVVIRGQGHVCRCVFQNN